MKIPELRERIFFTLMMFLVARVGTLIPAPGVDVDRLAAMTSQNDILGYINMFSGGAFTRVSIFALGIIPYINSSIVVSLLASIIPQLEEIQKEGESGRNRITQWTRYLTIALAIGQGAGVCLWLQSVGLVYNPGLAFFSYNNNNIDSRDSIFNVGRRTDIYKRNWERSFINNISKCNIKSSFKCYSNNTNDARK